MSEIITQYLVAILGVLGGMVFLVNIVVEVTKNIPGVKKIPTQLWVIIVSVVLCALAFTGYFSYKGYDITWYLCVLCIMASFIVSYIAMFGWSTLKDLWNRSNYKTSASTLTGKGLANFALSKLGTPYVYGAKGADGKFTQNKLNSLAKAYKSVFTASYIAKAKKFVGKVCCDCSGLISWYTGKVLGSAQLYSTASKKEKLDKKDTSKVPIGAVLWKSGHVAVYIGDGYCVEEKGIDYGCVKIKVKNTKFTHYLLFSYMEYDEVKVPKATSKNPYTKPNTNLKKRSKGDSVKWLQYELREAGYKKVEIDGIFGSITKKFVGKFQKSSKLTVDYIVGEKTIKALVADK